MAAQASPLVGKTPRSSGALGHAWPKKCALTRDSRWSSDAGISSGSRDLALESRERSPAQSEVVASRVSDATRVGVSRAWS